MEQFSQQRSALVVEGEVALARVVDRDDDVTLALPAKRAGALDYPYDVDVYLLPLSAGESIRVHVDSVLIDPLVRVGYRAAGDVEMIDDDDSGGGVFGLNAELIYHAEYVSTYLLVIDDPSGEVGGYTLTVEPAGNG